MNIWVRNYKIFLPILFILEAYFVYVIMLVPDNYVTKYDVIIVQEEKSEITLEDRIDVTSRNYDECLEIRDQLAKEIQLYNNNVENWQRWMLRQKICESYKKRLEKLRNNFNEKKQD